MQGEQAKNPPDLEAQPIPVAVAEPQPPVTRVVRVYEIPVSHFPLDEPEDPNAYMLPCTIVGCAFSWIPIVGCMTWLCNMDAPPRTPRKFWATAACAVAMTFVVFGLIFGSTSSAY